jgi:hypothetical protein
MNTGHDAVALAIRLQARKAARDALLRRITTQVLADSRVVASWLFGSLSRQSADALSDIDLWLVIEDDDIGAIAAARHDYVAQVAVPLMVYDGPQNAPEGGAYLMALYAGPDGPLQVDWYWQPRSTARRPRQVKMLFDRIGIPAAAPMPGPLEPREPQSPEERAVRVTHVVSFFWVMANIAAKTIVRREPWHAVHVLAMLEGTRQEARWLVGDRPDHPGFSPHRDVAPPLYPREQMVLLGQLVEEMGQLHPRVEHIGASVPHAAIPEIYRFHQLIATMISEEEDKPGE